MQMLTWNECSPGMIVLRTDSSAALGFVKRKGGAMEPGQRILKVHMVTVNKLPTASQKSQLLEQLIAKLLDFDRCSNLSNIDDVGRRGRRWCPHSLAELYRFAMNFLLVRKRKRRRNRDGKKRGK